MATKQIDVTVAILTFNGDRYLDSILTAIEQQQFEGSVDVLVLDSGSTDGTLAIVANHPSVRLHQIPNTEFGHGRTRNLAASLASGRVVAYLTHDAVPADNHWLQELVEPLDKFPGVEAVLGRQIARPDCTPLLKYEIRRVFSTQGPEFATTLSYRTGAFDRQPHYWLPAAFYSDVNSAAHRDFLLKKVAYQDVDYAEDQLFGRDVLDGGYLKAYSPRGAVIHSNDLSYREYQKRIFDEIVGLRRSGAVVPPSPSALRLFVRAVVLDPADILRDREYSPGRKLYWLIVNPFYHLGKSRASRRARRIRLSDTEGIAKGSLERARRAP